MDIPALVIITVMVMGILFIGVPAIFIGIVDLDIVDISAGVFCVVLFSVGIEHVFPSLYIKHEY